MASPRLARVLLCGGLILQLGIAPQARAVPGTVVCPADPTVVTDSLTSAGAVFGFSALGGAYINRIAVTDTNLIAPGFGRGGQTAIRDRLHFGSHNPTQAGFRDGAGAPATIEIGPSISGPGERVYFAPFPAPLFRIPFFDFTEHEDVYDDGFADDAGGTDTDGVPEPGIGQDTELRGEFDCSGYYEDASGLVSDRIPVVRHVIQFDFVRSPGAILQFQSAAADTGGNPILIPGALVSDLAPVALAGLQPADTTDYSAGISSYSIRVRWSLGYHTCMWVDTSGTWQSDSVTVCNQVRTVRAFGDQYLDLFDPGAGNPWQYIGGNPATFVGETNRPYLLLSTGTDPDTSQALGLFYPQTSPCNRFPVEGIRADAPAFQEDRRFRVLLSATRRSCGFDTGMPYRTVEGATFENDFTSVRATLYFTGLQNPDHAGPQRLERVRMDVYLLLGSPNQIRQAIEELEAGDLSSSDCAVFSTATTSVGGGPLPRPEVMRAAPNPFRNSTRVRFLVRRAGPVRLTAHDIAGRRVATLFNGNLPAGPAGIPWDGRGTLGRRLAPGLYFLRLVGAEGTEVSRVVVLR